MPFRLGHERPPAPRVGGPFIFWDITDFPGCQVLGQCMLLHARKATMAHVTTNTGTIIEALRKRRTYVPSTEAMATLGVTRQTLCRWIAEGRITAVRIGTTWKIDPAHLASWLEERQVGL